MKSLSFAGVLSMLIVGQACAELSVSSLFSDHMVLQRDKTVSFWGKASPGSDITVSIMNQSYRGIANAEGKWRVSVSAHSKAGPFDVQISGDGEKTIRDVYFGDVWVAGGQSNMEWNLQDGVIGSESEIANSADFSRIRLFDVPNTVSHKPLEEIPASHWVTASPDTTGHFSAVAWYFAKQVAQHEDVAVGIIESNWGGTPAEAWTDAEKLLQVPGYEQAAKDTLDTHNWPEQIEQNTQLEQRKWQRIQNVEEAIQTRAQLPDYDDSEWRLIDLPNTTALHHFVWLRKTFQLNDIPAQGITLNFGDIVQNAFIFINGKLLAKEDWQNSDSVHHIAAEQLKVGENLIALRVNNDWDNQVTVGREGQIWLEVANEKRDFSHQWRTSNTVEAPMPKVIRHSFTPGFLYNAMIKPMMDYTSKGAIWYQGESNVEQHQFYQVLFETMIANWRELADDPSWPFFFVQIAAYLPHQELQPNSSWAYLRDSQKAALRLPQTGMAVTIDIGEALDIHPRNKQPVGERLWRQAAHSVYGVDLVSSGPNFTHMEQQGTKLVLYFDNAEQLQTSDGQAPKSFIIAGQDRRFAIANAKIVGNHIELSHPQIQHPVAVRYAWADNPQVNLINLQQLPAVPFRTDSWPLETVSTLK